MAGDNQDQMSQESKINEVQTSSKREFVTHAVSTAVLGGDVIFSIPPSLFMCLLPPSLPLSLSSSLFSLHSLRTEFLYITKLKHVQKKS